MKHTREQLDGMSDLEITEVIARKLGMEIINQSDDAVMCGYTGMRSTVADRNYCNNWNDIMPLAVKYGVSLISGVISAATNKPYEFTNYKISDPDFRAIGGHHHVDKSPQRAIACCLIMVLEAKG